jgi:outer membrane protein
MSIKKIMILLGLVGTMQVYADAMKFGVINADRVFTESKPAKTLQTALMNKFKPLQMEVQNFGQTLLSEQKQLENAMKTARTPSEQANVQKLQQKYQNDRMILQKRMYNVQKAMQKAQETFVASFMNKANTILKSVAERENLDLVLTSNQVAFAKVKYDVTDKLIEEINNKLSVNELISQINSMKVDVDAPLPEAANNAAVH